MYSMPVFVIIQHGNEHEQRMLLQRVDEEKECVLLAAAWLINRRRRKATRVPDERSVCVRQCQTVALEKAPIMDNMKNFSTNCDRKTWGDKRNIITMDSEILTELLQHVGPCGEKKDTFWRMALDLSRPVPWKYFGYLKTGDSRWYNNLCLYRVTKSPLDMRIYHSRVLKRYKNLLIMEP